MLYHISPMALYRLICAFGHLSLVAVLTRSGLPLPVYFLADEKHSRCLTEKVYLPMIVRGRVLWHLGYTEDASAAAFTASMVWICSHDTGHMWEESSPHPVLTRFMRLQKEL